MCSGTLINNNELFDKIEAQDYRGQIIRTRCVVIDQAMPAMFTATT